MRKTAFLIVFLFSSIIFLASPQKISAGTDINGLGQIKITKAGFSFKIKTLILPDLLPRSTFIPLPTRIFRQTFISNEAISP